MKTTAEALATEAASVAHWARGITVRDKEEPALQCGVCQEVYAELTPGNIASTMGTAAAEHIKTAHLDFWAELVVHATQCLLAARTYWEERRHTIQPELRPTLRENELFTHWVNIYIPCPSGCGVEMHEALTEDQIKDKDKLQVSNEVADLFITHLAEHLMVHTRRTITDLLSQPL